MDLPTTLVQLPRDFASLLVLLHRSTLRDKRIGECQLFGFSVTHAPSLRIVQEVLSIKKASGSNSPEAFMVEVAGFEPASEDIQHNGPTCVANVLEFATAHAH